MEFRCFISFFLRFYSIYLHFNENKVSTFFEQINRIHSVCHIQYKHISTSIQKDIDQFTAINKLMKSDEKFILEKLLLKNSIFSISVFKADISENDCEKYFLSKWNPKSKSKQRNTIRLYRTDKWCLDANFFQIFYTFCINSFHFLKMKQKRSRIKFILVIHKKNAQQKNNGKYSNDANQPRIFSSINEIRNGI